MFRVTFESLRLPAPRTLSVSAGTLLIDVIRSEGLPLWWRCGHGTCGACAVTLCHAGQPVPVQLTKKERNVLIRHGFLPSSAVTGTLFEDDPAQVRLACHVAVMQDMTVCF